MANQAKLYIAGTGMITSVGADTAMTAAAVRAGISGYNISTDFYGQNSQAITMACVPVFMLDELDAEIGRGSHYNNRHDRVIRMAIIAIREGCKNLKIDYAIPLVLSASADEVEEEKGLTPFIDNIEKNCQPWVHSKKYRTVSTGRAAGMEALDYIFQHLDSLTDDYVLVGGSDSYQDYAIINKLSQKDRLLSEGNRDGFAPGEGACFLLLTKKVELAMQRNGEIVAINPPGIAMEDGCLESNEPYRGDGLDQAFKKALQNHSYSGIHSIYSSMNGEHHWAKEYGVAYIRNKDAFSESIKMEHPADCFGDLGAAMSTALIALAAENLFKEPKATSNLVYCSSDTTLRGAVVLEKQVVR